MRGVVSTGYECVSVGGAQRCGIFHVFAHTMLYKWLHVVYATGSLVVDHVGVRSVSFMNEQQQK